MVFLTSRRFVLPETFEEMADSLWFNLWTRRNWPIEELASGDTLYWYESPKQRVVWKTVVTEVRDFTYATKAAAAENMREWYGPFDEEQPYFREAPEAGYGLYYRVAPLARLDMQKPATASRLPMLGWVRLDAATAASWSISLDSSTTS
jgi:hypothetical protein